MWYLPPWDSDNTGVCPEFHTFEGLSPLSSPSCDLLGASSWLDPFLDRLQILSSRDSLNSLPKWPWSYFQGLNQPPDLLRTDRITRVLASKSKGWPRVICLQVGWASTCMCKRPLVVQDESGLKETERVDYGMSVFTFVPDPTDVRIGPGWIDLT